MKKTMKRAIALILTICTLFGIISPAVSATGGEQITPEPVELVYNFYPDGYRGQFKNHNQTIRDLYEGEEFDWRYEAGSERVENAVADDSTTGTNVAIMENTGFRLLLQQGDWIALRLRVPEAGKYDLTLVHGLMANGTRQANIYILPGSTANIAEAIADADSLGDPINFKADANDYSETTTPVAAWDCTAAGEYILVLEGAQSASDTSTHAYMVLYRLLLTEAQEEEEPEQPRELVYNFYPDDYRGQFKTHKQTIRDLYEGEEFNWRYEAGSERVENAVADDSTTGTNVAIMENTGFRLLLQQGDWIALRLRVPEAGKYDLTLVHGLMASGARQANIYILPGSTTNIAEAIADADSLGDPINFKADANDYSETTTPVAAWDCTAAGEYILVLEGAQSASDTSTHAYMVLYRLLLTEAQEGEEPEQPENPTVPEETVPPVQLDKAEYDFTEVEAVHGTAFGSSNATLNDLYASGKINWNYAGKSGNVHVAVMGGTSPEGKTPGTWSGMRFAVKPGGGWVAYRIQSPGTGDYAITAHYQTNKVLGQVSVYVLPGSTGDIDAALTGATAVGSYDCNSGSTEYADASTRLGAASFTAGEEYILVFYTANDTEKNIYAAVNKVTVKIPNGEDEEPEKPTVPEVTVPSVQLDKAEYDFASVEAVHGTAFGSSNATLNDLYASGKINWNYAGKSENNHVAVMGGTSPEGKTPGAWSGMRFAVKPGGGWVAYRIQSPGTGDYTVTVSYQTNKALGHATVHVLPGETTDIDAALTASTELGTYSCYNSGDAYVDTSKTFEKTAAFTSGKEYLLVFYIPNNNEKGNIYATVNGVILNIAAEAVKPDQTLDRIVYDFDLGNTDLLCQDKTFVTRNVTHAVVSKTVEGFYYNGIIDWNYHSASSGMELIASFGSIAEGKVWDGLCMYAKNKETGDACYNFYYAFKIRSPGTGDYKLTLDYAVHMNGAKQGSIYILPGDTADVAAAIASGEAIGTVNYDNGSYVTTDAAVAARSTYGNAISMEAGEEYILVFTSDVAGRANARLYVQSVTLTKADIPTPADIIPERKPEPKPIPAGSTVYDLDLSDPIKGVYKGKKKLILDVMSEISNGYGTRNWMWESHEVLSEASMAFLPTGMTVYGQEMDWIAIRIKSPGEGLYTVGLNHAISGNGATGAVYILPADTEDIGTAMDPANRVGKVSFTNDTGTTSPEDGSQTLAGTWEFGADEEYILVVEAYKKAIYHESRAYMMISQLFLTPGDIIEEKEDKKVVSPVVADPGPVKLVEGCYYATTAVVNGCDYLFEPIEGGKILVFDLDNEVLVDEIEVPFTVPRGMTTDEDGIVWIVGSKSVLYRYDPYTGVGETVKSFKEELPDSQSGFYLDYAEGCLYFGVNPTGCILKYEIATNTFTNLGAYSDDISYVNGVLYKDGYVYAGANGDKNGDGNYTWVVVKVKADTGELVGSLDVSHLVDVTRTMFYGAGFAGDLLLMGAEGEPGEQHKMIAIDSNTMEFVDLGVNGCISYGITEELDGKVYFVLSGMGLHSLDVRTREVEAVPGFKDTTIPVRCGKFSFVEVDDVLYPGKNIITYSGSNGIPRLYNIEKGTTKTFYDIIAPDYGNPTDTRVIINGMPGSNELYIGAYNTPNCAIYNTETGITTEFKAVSAQTDAMVFHEGVLYTGNYTAGCITRINLEDDSRNQVLLTLNDETYDQARIHTLTIGDDKLFAGSIPDKFGYGGCLAWIDLNTLERYVERNVVQDQSINSLVYHDGLIYGTSSIHGGTGSAKREDLSAKLFVYDVANKKKVAEFDLRDYMEGFEGNIEYISGIAADPNVDKNGRFWGLVSETLFTFHYDVGTGKLTVQEELSYGKNTYATGANKAWSPRSFCFDGEGNLFLAFENNGGMRRINTENTADNERVMPYTPALYAQGEDGNLYYLHKATLYMYPLNVTEEDWAKAEKVDALILAIGDEITLKSEEAIMAARTAYDALSLKHKALIQNLEALEEAECDLMELQIEALPEIVTLEHKDHLLNLQTRYAAMTVRQQKYVKNYELLEAAEAALNVLLDKQAAAEVQAMIDSIKDLGELTLDHKDRIIEIRAAYDALTSYQKQYVDATALLEAEAKMAVLRAEAIERLKALIASIGEVTLEDEPIIVEADSIFSWLTLEERQQVDGATLSAAKIALTKLQKAAAAEVDALIDAIGTVGRASGDAIAAARAAYDALTPGSKAYVEKLAVLEAAEAAFAQYGGLGTVGIIAIVAAVVAAAGIAAVVLLVPDLRKKLFKR